VFQRPQHLMSRFARTRRVFFVEEPVFEPAAQPFLQTAVCPHTNVHVLTPHLACEADRNLVLSQLLTQFAVANDIKKPILWFYTPMALEFFPRSIVPAVVVYDCMDELSMFRGASRHLQILETQLLDLADLVFTGGVSLFEAKREMHSRVYVFPSGVDVHHFQQARSLTADFQEHQGIGRPRLGYAGVIDERIDLSLLEEVAQQRPRWQIVMIGPTAKISPDDLPRLANIHWLGMKDYRDLPAYFAGWDVGIMPFALNDATRFISPTKTPEYLAAGLPVVSTPIRDVVRPYGELGLVRIGRSTEEFIDAAEQAMVQDMSIKWRQRSDEFLKSLSWDSVWIEMDGLIAGILNPHDSVRRGAQLAVSAQQENARV
jgi:UDP-galactopyranose mutase